MTVRLSGIEIRMRLLLKEHERRNEAENIIFLRPGTDFT
jgi:hypothetical protein